MRKIIFILLLSLTSLAWTQRGAFSGGKRVASGGMVMGPDPETLAAGPASAWAGYDMYYFTDFDQVGLGRYSEADVESELGAVSTKAHDTYGQVVIFGTDTVLIEYIDEGQNSTPGDTANWAIDVINDTLTAIMFQVNMGVKPGIRYGQGFKIAGPAGRGSGDQSIPSGGVSPIVEGDSMGFHYRPKFWPSGGDSTFMGVYAYDHTITGTPSYGNDYALTTHLDKSDTVIYNLVFHIVLNTIASEGNGNSDGIFEMLINGTCEYSVTNMVFREYSDQTIGVMSWGFYFGGSQAALRDEWYVYADYFWGYFNDDHSHTPRTAVGVSNSIAVPNYPLQIHTDYPAD